jgi:hypothetical protein
MGRTGQIVFSALLGALFPYSMGLGYLDILPLSVYGLWGMVLTRERPWWKSWLEIAVLVAAGLVIVNLRSTLPRWVFPPATVLGACALLWAALALFAELYPYVWLPWLVAAVFYFAPGEYFLTKYVATAAVALLAIVAVRRLLRSKIPANHEQ